MKKKKFVYIIFVLLCLFIICNNFESAFLISSDKFDCTGVYCFELNEPIWQKIDIAGQSLKSISVRFGTYDRTNEGDGFLLSGKKKD